MSKLALGLHLEIVLILPEAQLEKEAREHKGRGFFLPQGGKSFTGPGGDSSGPFPGVSHLLEDQS